MALSPFTNETPAYSPVGGAQIGKERFSPSCRSSMNPALIQVGVTSVAVTAMLSASKPPIEHDPAGVTVL